MSENDELNKCADNNTAMIKTKNDIIGGRRERESAPPSSVPADDDDGPTTWRRSIDRRQAHGGFLLSAFFSPFSSSAVRHGLPPSKPLVKDDRARVDEIETALKFHHIC